MSRAVRLAAAALGLALAVYGTSTLTGLWLGNPPWWDEAAASVAQLSGEARADLIDADLFVEWRRDGSSVVVVLMGLALASWGAWPRRRRVASSREYSLHGPAGILSPVATLGILLLVLAVFVAGVAVLGPFSTWTLP